MSWGPDTSSLRGVVPITSKNDADAYRARMVERGETPPVLPAFYGKPIDTPTGYRWAGYTAPAGHRTSMVIQAITR